MKHTLNKGARSGETAELMRSVSKQGSVKVISHWRGEMMKGRVTVVMEERGKSKSAALILAPN